MNMPRYPSLYQINTRVSPQNYNRVKRQGGRSDPGLRVVGVVSVLIFFFIIFHISN